MSGFNLSPGITPLLTDLFVLEFPIALGLAYALRGGRGVEAAFAFNAGGLGVIKLVTDYFDLPDVVVGLAGLAAAAAILWSLGQPSNWRSPPSWAWRGLGLAILIVGSVKVMRDFFDPFDLLLADVCIVAGAWLLMGTLPRPASREPPPVATERVAHLFEDTAQRSGKTPEELRIALDR